MESVLEFHWEILGEILGEILEMDSGVLLANTVCLWVFVMVFTVRMCVYGESWLCLYRDE